MKKYLFILCVIIVGSVNVNAQNFGFMGKKSFFETNLVFNSPIVSNLMFYRRTYLYDYDENRRPYGPLNIGVYVSAGRTINRNFALSVEGGIDFMSFKLKNGFYFDEDMYNVHCINLMPKIEFSRSEHILPVGISHQLGIGVIKQNYTVTGSEQYVYTGGSIGGSMMYAAVVRTCLTKHILLNFGMRYTLNLLMDDDGLNVLIWSNEAQLQKNLNFVSGQLGLTYLF